MNRTFSKLSLFASIYTILISAWFASWWVVGDSNWWLTLLNRVVPYLFIPVPLFLLSIIRSRQFKLIIVLLLPILIFGRLYLPYLFPKPKQAGESKSELRVMTYNVLFSNGDYDRVANIILTYHPDLVALQEVQPEMMNALEERLVENYPYSLMSTENAYGTTAIFSRYPFTASYVLDLQADRPAVVVKTKIDDKEITFISMHLLAYGLQWVRLPDIPKAVVERTTRQNRQVEILIEEIRENNGIIIVGCDCNSYETSSSYRILEQSMSNAARTVGWSLDGNGLSNVKHDTALQHIDYVWFQGTLEPIGVYTINDNGGSDHLPVIAVFNLK